MIGLSIYPVIWLCEQLGYLVNIVFPVGEKILIKGDASVDGRSSPEMRGKTSSWGSVSCGIGVGSLAVCTVLDKLGEERSYRGQLGTCSVASDNIGLSFK